jgi:hypothetical protein
MDSPREETGVDEAPFGFVYVREARGGFEVQGYPYSRAGERLFHLLGYDSQLHWGEAQEPAHACLRACVEQEPAVAGRLDMGFLVYQPDHRYKRGQTMP